MYNKIVLLTDHYCDAISDILFTCRCARTTGQATPAFKKCLHLGCDAIPMDYYCMYNKIVLLTDHYCDSISDILFTCRCARTTGQASPAFKKCLHSGCDEIPMDYYCMYNKIVLLTDHYCDAISDILFTCRCARTTGQATPAFKKCLHSRCDAIPMDYYCMYNKIVLLTDHYCDSISDILFTCRCARTTGQATPAFKKCLHSGCDAIPMDYYCMYNKIVLLTDHYCDAISDILFTCHCARTTGQATPGFKRCLHSGCDAIPMDYYCMYIKIALLTDHYCDAISDILFTCRCARTTGQATPAFKKCLHLGCDAIPMDYNCMFNKIVLLTDHYCDAISDILFTCRCARTTGQATPAFKRCLHSGCDAIPMDYYCMYNKIVLLTDHYCDAISDILFTCRCARTTGQATPAFKRCLHSGCDAIPMDYYCMYNKIVLLTDHYCSQKDLKSSHTILQEAITI